MQKVGVIAKVRWDSPNTRNHSYTQNIDYITRGLDEHEKQEVLEWNDILDRIKNDSSNEQGFSRYLDYMERQEVEFSTENQTFKTRKSSVLATDNGFKTKSGKEGLFDFYHDIVSPSQRRFYHRKFDEAYHKGGLLWKPIVSFDNDWLREQGVLVNDVIDEEKLKQTARQMMTALLKERQLERSVYWVGQLHYDTDNIHFHVAMVEKNPTSVQEMSEEEEKSHGKFSQKSINQMKSTCVRELADRTKEKQQIYDVTRVRILGVAKETRFKENYRELFDQLSHKLSCYNYKNLKPYEKKWINTLSYEILQTHFPSEYQRFIELTINEEAFYRRSYGDRSKDLFKDYSENCEKDLLQRLGNTISKQIKEYRQTEGLLDKQDLKSLSNEVFQRLVSKEVKIDSISREPIQESQFSTNKEKERDMSRSFSYPYPLNNNFVTDHSQKSTDFKPVANVYKGASLNRLNYQVNQLRRNLEREINQSLNEYEKLLQQQDREKECDYGR